MLLTKREHDQIESSLPFAAQSLKQTNYYFETKEFALKNKHAALRIREINGFYTLTLKEPFGDGILETHDTLTLAVFNRWLQSKPTFTKHVTDRIEHLGVNLQTLEYAGFLTTSRKRYTENETDYFLDTSMYNGQTDYEIEIEAKSMELATKKMEEIIRTFTITRKKTLPKIARFFQTIAGEEIPHSH